ncbi:uncharacterized protein BJX67DRAFT_183746 [Aspergillus lucknowensis]|uniref:Uncharacterized protein n=1 Tax=Aspergillus lucknowensis TaxID=176173 RepID=A0ABR4LLK9_9EURO
MEKLSCRSNQSLRNHDLTSCHAPRDQPQKVPSVDFRAFLFLFERSQRRVIGNVPSRKIMRLSAGSHAERPSSSESFKVKTPEESLPMCPELSKARQVSILRAGPQTDRPAHPSGTAKTVEPAPCAHRNSLGFLQIPQTRNVIPLQGIQRNFSLEGANICPSIRCSSNSRAVIPSFPLVPPVR